MMFRIRPKTWRWVVLSAIASLSLLIFTLIPPPILAESPAHSPVAVTSTTVLTADIDIRDPICDVYPNSPYYSDLVLLIEKYGVDISLPDGTCRLAQPLTRGDFVVYLNQALDRMVELIEASTPSPAQ